MSTPRTVSGWRLAGALWHPQLGLKLAHVDLDPTSGTFWQYAPAECRPGTYPTQHRAHTSPTPDPDCSCGYHVVVDLADLLAWPDLAHRQTPDAADLEPAFTSYREGLAKFWVIVTVTTLGRVLPPAPGAGDPRGTYRAAGLTLSGGAILDRRAPQEAAALLREAGLLVSEVHDLDDLQALVA